MYATRYLTSGMPRTMYSTFQRQALIGWADWLNGKEWHFFCTLSTKYSISVEGTRRAMQRLYNFITENYGGVRIFWVAEPFDTRYGYHAHAFIYFEDTNSRTINELRKFTIRAWQIVTKGGGQKKYNHTHILPYIKNLGAHYYISKYMHRNNSEYDFLGDFTPNGSLVI